MPKTYKPRERKSLRQIKKEVARILATETPSSSSCFPQPCIAQASATSETSSPSQHDLLTPTFDACSESPVQTDESERTHSSSDESEDGVQVVYDKDKHSLREDLANCFSKHKVSRE